MAASDNPFYIQPANPMQALMAGVQGFQGGQQRANEEQMKAGRLKAVQALQSGAPLQNVLGELINSGDVKMADTIANFAQQQAAQGHRAAQLAQTGAHQREMADIARAGLDAPVVIPYGAGLANKRGNILREPMNTGLLDPETISAMADQYRAGDTSVLTNLGRGAQGAENIVALRKAIAEKNTALGQGGADQAVRNAEFFGVKAGQRTLGTKQANIELAATEFQQVLPVVQKASEAVSRTNYPDLNKIIQAYEEKTGGPEIVAFGGGVNTLINLYSRAISPSGIPTVSDKNHAREILQKAWSQGQFNAAVGMMNSEIEAALKSPEKVRDDMRKRFMEGQGAAQPAHAAPSPSSGVIKWEIGPDGNPRQAR